MADGNYHPSTHTRTPDYGGSHGETINRDNAGDGAEEALHMGNLDQASNESSKEALGPVSQSSQKRKGGGRPKGPSTSWSTKIAPREPSARVRNRVRAAAAEKAAVASAKAAASESCESNAKNHEKEKQKTRFATFSPGLRRFAMTGEVEEEQTSTNPSKRNAAKRDNFLQHSDGTTTKIDAFIQRHSSLSHKPATKKQKRDNGKSSRMPPPSKDAPNTVDSPCPWHTQLSDIPLQMVPIKHPPVPPHNAQNISTIAPALTDATNPAAPPVQTHDQSRGNQQQSDFSNANGATTKAPPKQQSQQSTACGGLYNGNFGAALTFAAKTMLNTAHQLLHWAMEPDTGIRSFQNSPLATSPHMFLPYYRTTLRRATEPKDGFVFHKEGCTGTCHGRSRKCRVCFDDGKYATHNYIRRSFEPNPQRAKKNTRTKLIADNPIKARIEIEALRAENKRLRNALNAYERDSLKKDKEEEQEVEQEVEQEEEVVELPPGIYMC